jgi:hypothetical protein
MTSVVIFLKSFGEMAAESGEPLQPGWQRMDVEKMMTRCGLQVLDHPTREDFIGRYFANRSDGLMPYTAQDLVAATLHSGDAAETVRLRP